METQNKPWSIVLVPRPLTPFTAFAWYAISELLPEYVFVKNRRYFRWVNMTRPRGEMYSPHGVVFNLNTCNRGEFEAELIRWLKSPLVAFPNWQTVGVRYFSYGCKANPRFVEWLEKLSQMENPEVALGISSAFFRKLVCERIDPRKTQVNFPVLPFLPVRTAFPEVNSQFPITMPVLKERKSLQKHREVIAYTRKVIPEAPIFQLCGKHLLLAITGEPGVGKSTVAASLLVAMRDVIEAYKSRWPQLDLTVELSSLDEATKVADAVLESKGQNRRKMRARKMDWTVELADAVVQRCQAKLQSANIVLADMPGKITNITELLSAHTTVAGIVTKDWAGEALKWRDHLEAIKAPLVFQAKASRAQSIVTSYNPGERMMGRIFLPNRVVRAWDPFIQALARLLLIDILPAKVGTPQDKPINQHHREDDCVTIQLPPRKD